MKQKEKLIELLNVDLSGCEGDPLEEAAEYLINNGVVVLPCKVGDTVYQIYKETVWNDEYRMSYHYELCVRKVPFRIEMTSAIEKTVFLTREEAEAALKGE